MVVAEGENLVFETRICQNHNNVNNVLDLWSLFHHSHIIKCADFEIELSLFSKRDFDYFVILIVFSVVEPSINKTGGVITRHSELVQKSARPVPNEKIAIKSFVPSQSVLTSKFKYYASH